MKILCVAINHAPEQTGIGKFQGEMVAWLVARGHQVRVITAPPYYPEWKVAKGYSSRHYTTETIDGAVVTRVPLYLPAAPGGAKRLLHLGSFALASLPSILRQTISWRPDVILATAPPLLAAPGVLLAGSLAGARTHMHVQDFEVDAAFNLGMLKQPWLYRFASFIEHSLLRGFTRVSSISPRMCDRLLAKGVEQGRAFLVPNWGSIADFDPAKGPGHWRETLGATTSTVLVLYSGNMGRKQGLETIADAARLLQDKPNIQFVVSGDGAGRIDLMARAADLKNIRFLPVQPWSEFAHLMIAADIHLLPQRAEAADLVMPSKLGNILASGKPVVAGASANTQIYDAVQGCGLAVEPENAEEFAHAIAALAEDAPLRVKMGETGRQRAQQDWGKESILMRLEAILQNQPLPAPSV
jgi:colanic acid biosynthesis glycosyl transferase WcaI